MSFGHELMTVEELCDEKYTALEDSHNSTGAALREALSAYEEVLMAACVHFDSALDSFG